MNQVAVSAWVIVGAFMLLWGIWKAVRWLMQAFPKALVGDVIDLDELRSIPIKTVEAMALPIKMAVAEAVSNVQPLDISGFLIPLSKLVQDSAEQTKLLQDLVVYQIESIRCLKKINKVFAGAGYEEADDDRAMDMDAASEMQDRYGLSREEALKRVQQQRVYRRDAQGRMYATEGK